MDAHNFSFVSLEYLEAYGNRLRWNLVFNVPINGLAAFIVLRYSTVAMGMYKYFILTTIISAFVMDFHSSIVYGFYDFVPTPISCPTGITRTLGYFWGTTVNFILIHYTMSFCGLSLTYSIIYQYYSLTKDAEIFHKPKTIIAMFTSVLLYPLPAVIAYSFSLDHEAAKAYVFENYPDIAKIFVAASCSAQIISPKFYIYFSIAAMEIFILFVFAVTVGSILAFKLQKLKHSLSASTLKAHKQYILALCIQGTVPFLFIVIPVIFMILTTTVKMANVQDAFEWAFQCFGFHSCGNAIAVMYIIKPYRKAIFGWIQKLITIFYKNKTPVKILAVSSTIQSTNSMSIIPSRSY